VSDRQRRPRVLGEYELEGGAFGAARTAARGEQRDIRFGGAHGDGPGDLAEHRSRALSRPGTLWRAVLHRIRTD
jgi:hypothetical protein